MTPDSAITEEMRSRIGVETPPAIYEIERESIRRFAQAIGDDNPLYLDEDYAAKSKYGRLVAPPGMIGNYEYPTNGAPHTARVQSPFWRRFNGGNEYEYFKPVLAGDTLTATSKLVELNDRMGGPDIGRMLVQVVETTFRNQHGDVVAKERRTNISYEGRPKEEKR